MKKNKRKGRLVFIKIKHEGEEELTIDIFPGNLGKIKQRELDLFIDKYTIFDNYYTFLLVAEENTSSELWYLENFVEREFETDKSFNSFIKNNTRFKNWSKMLESWNALNNKL